LQKGEYIHNLLKEILRLNPKGITVSQVDKSTYLGRSTIWHHLEILASRAECLKIQRGDIDIYHSNKVLESLKDFNINGIDFYYNFDLVENTFGKFLRLQMKQEGRTGSIVNDCGILINLKFFGDVLSSLNQIKENI